VLRSPTAFLTRLDRVAEQIDPRKIRVGQNKISR